MTVMLLLTTMMKTLVSFQAPEFGGRFDALAMKQSPF